jgi:hypothetical protein
MEPFRPFYGSERLSRSVNSFTLPAMLPAVLLQTRGGLVWPWVFPG